MLSHDTLLILNNNKKKKKLETPYGQPLKLCKTENLATLPSLLNTTNTEDAFNNLMCNYNEEEILCPNKQVELHVGSTFWHINQD